MCIRDSLDTPSNFRFFNNRNECLFHLKRKTTLFRKEMVIVNNRNKHVIGRIVSSRVFPSSRKLVLFLRDQHKQNSVSETELGYIKTQLQRDWLQLLRSPDQQKEPIATFVEDMSAFSEVDGVTEPDTVSKDVKKATDGKKETKKSDNSRRMVISVISKENEPHMYATILAMGVELEIEKYLSEHPVMELQRALVIFGLVGSILYSGACLWNRINSEEKT
eukprot:TRINITY_DN4683_c0_g1_i1.p1 TRINITY_DN4683_c0_g1~~TRINITY_DN4683_c0_g1_i1.p1  ORF type:complete len:220 (+),score=30.15 TRINITY_DN4683_c0_g1_i1:33-692(+)